VVTGDNIRVRWIGHRLKTNLTISVADRLSLSQGHEVAPAVGDAITARAPKLDTLLVALAPAHAIEAVES